MGQKKNREPETDYNTVLEGTTKKSILDEWKPYPEEITDALFIKANNCMNSEYDETELKNTINQIVLWKVHRMVDLDSSVLQKLVDKSLDANAADINAVKKWWEDKDNTDKTKALIKSMVDSKSNGVRLAMASTILHFFHPFSFLIIDQRSYRVIHSWAFEKGFCPSTESDHELNHSEKDAWDVYCDYMKLCIKYYESNNLKQDGIEFDKLDRYTYQLDLEKKNYVYYK